MASSPIVAASAAFVPPPVVESSAVVSFLRLRKRRLLVEQQERQPHGHGRHRQRSCCNKLDGSSTLLWVVADLGTSPSASVGFVEPIRTTTWTLATTTTTTEMTDTTTSTMTSFEPVLNVPAFSVFVFIALVFGLLQYRMAAIGTAADRRTQALSNLRTLKAQQLSYGYGRGDKIKTDAVTDNTTASSSSSNIDDQVHEALDEYRDALWEVERLRTVIPGLVRIPPPPSESASRERMDENAVAAKQFLNITLPSLTDAIAKDDNDDKNNNNTNNNKKKVTATNGNQMGTTLQPWMFVILILTLTTQLSLLWLFTVDSNTLMGGSSSLFAPNQ